MENIKEMYEKIGLTKEMEEVVNSVSVDHNKYLIFKELFNTDIDLFYAQVKSKKRFRQLFLYLYLNFAFDVYSTYKQYGISDTIYFNTFHDIVIWTLNCKRDFGELGLNEYDWIKLHLKMKLFKLGRLQYEIVESKEDILFNQRLLKANEKVLNLHIPQGEPLNIDKCKESLKQARDFFGDYKEITCHSWLLSPQLKELLLKDSNILQFQKLFHIYSLDIESREAEERVFLKLQDDPQLYEETTTLQKELKYYLIRGKKIGSAYGVVKFF